MKLAKVLLGVLAVGLSVHLSAQTQSWREEGENLVIQRESGVASVNYRLFLDGEPLARLMANKTQNFNVEPGDYTIHANDSERTAIPLSVSEDAVTYLLVRLDRNGDVYFDVQISEQALAGQ